MKLPLATQAATNNEGQTYERSLSSRVVVGATIQRSIFRGLRRKRPAGAFGKGSPKGAKEQLHFSFVASSPVLGIALSTHLSSYGYNADGKVLAWKCLSRHCHPSPATINGYEPESFRDASYQSL